MTANNVPTVLVIFGATGDLMVKKIVPALYHLYEKQKLPKMFKVFGVARRPLTDQEFHEHIGQILREHPDVKTNKDDVDKFFNYFSYHQGNFDVSSDYKSLAKILGRVDNEWKVCSNKLFYLAVPPDATKPIFKHLAASGLTIPCGPNEGWTRVIVEKPFGENQKTAEELDMLLGKLFKEEQIYRIDHYLAKEMLQNILNFRFSNTLFEQSWNNKFIEKIEIRLLESIGVEGRGGFYDGVGALRDVGQNHLLQMLALITMEDPGNLEAETVRRLRAQVLNSLRVFTSREIKNYTFRGQYKGYREIKGVVTNSKTETYFKVLAFLDSTRWQGVPIILESGKRLEKSKEIVVTFKHPSPCLCPPGKHFKNTVTFSLEPKEAITIDFLSKTPGLTHAIEKRSFDFTIRDLENKSQYVEEYEKLLLDCINGNQLLFLSTEEVKTTWNYIDPIINAWKKDQVPLVMYQPDNDEVRQQSKLIEQFKSDITLRKELGVIGLGKMGANLARQLVEKNWKVVGFNRTFEKTKELAKEGIVAATSIKELVQKLQKPRILYVIVPTGKPTDEMLDELSKYLDKGDIVIESANAYYKDTMKRAKKITKKGIRFIDIGISGGPAGARNGACLMIGGDKNTFDYLLPLFTDISIAGGVSFFPGVGAGHFVKMVHNGIEYGMMQALGEGFEILHKSNFNLDLSKVTSIYNHGSVIESRLTKWLDNAYKMYGRDLKEISGSVGQGGGGAGVVTNKGEAAWAIDEAKEKKIPAVIIEKSLQAREISRRKPSYQGKVVNALRNQFGGHGIK